MPPSRTSPNAFLRSLISVLISLAVFFVEDGASLFARQALGLYCQDRDKHQRSGENNLLHSSDKDFRYLLRLHKEGFFI